MDRLDQQEVFVVSQDELGSQKKCVQMMQRALSKGQHVIVDRYASQCNLQRAVTLPRQVQRQRETAHPMD